MMKLLLPLEAAAAGSRYEWVSGAQKMLSRLSQGPLISSVDSGKHLADCILSMQSPKQSLDNEPMITGLDFFFENVVPQSSSSNRKFFHSTLPSMATLALGLPELLEQNLETEVPDFQTTYLRVLPSQEPGIVFISQELASSLLACSFFCLFPAEGRFESQFNLINFNTFFAGIMRKKSQQQKMLCILHYFERVCEEMPRGMVSYERKILLPLESEDEERTFWKKSERSLCSFKVFENGSIETHENEALEVDFANKFLGGGTLGSGCVQEEIRFMTNPELIVGMLFLPMMESNETIEITGAETYSKYEGYGGSFSFAGDYSDVKPRDRWGRRMTRIVAMDALSRPGDRQFLEKMILREMNKAYCGFLDHNPASKAHSTEANVGVATGNWGCGAFGGDLELKSMIQWLAASQAERPFVCYYTFADPRAARLQETVDWITRESWNVGDLCRMLMKYGKKKTADKMEAGFFDWLRPVTGIPALLFKMREFFSSVRPR